MSIFNEDLFILKGRTKWRETRTTQCITIPSFEVLFSSLSASRPKPHHHSWYKFISSLLCKSFNFCKFSFLPHLSSLSLHLLHPPKLPPSTRLLTPLPLEAHQCLGQQMCLSLSKAIERRDSKYLTHFFKHKEIGEICLILVSLHVL